MTANRNLPFEPTSEALAGWLDSLSKLPHAQAAHQLNQVLKQLKDEKCQTGVLLALLTNLTPLTLHFSGSLSASASNEPSSSGTAYKLGKLSMQLPRQLGLLFCQLAESNTLEGTDLQTAIYYALQLIGICFRSYSLFYEAPSATLWKKSAALFKLASTNDCLNTSQATKLAEFKSQTTIETVVKRNLLFSVLMPNQFSREEINQFFLLANQHADLLEITSDRQAWNFGFYWDLNDELPPCPVRKTNKSLPEGYIAIDSQRISHDLQLGGIATKLPPSTQNKLALFLSGYHQVFGSIIPGLPSYSKLILGFGGITNYLQELNKLVKIQQLSSLSGEKSLKRDLSLVPLEHQRNVFEALDQPFSAKQQSVGKSVNVLKTPNKLYQIAESRGLDCSTGDLALLYKEQHPVSLAIIRQQNFNDLSNANHVLLEMVPGQCTIYSLAKNAIVPHAIIVGEDSEHPQVFLASGKYNVGGKIQLSIGHSLILTACLESNAYFARFKFSFDS
ncbi:hypothetical protein IVG45_01755 [Methylomonas sp. LL1]|uniref:hypothetical protein n=1 Tax=Methylomonas sp. LL1 TaxID=2785785 RepID=UPI0018C3B77C|nr:hypothetical protein [Methylomonas sp. LL1]QPK63729.1 hypothetical protein IVG45_01755 [Methylomonas sp. LL1]